MMESCDHTIAAWLEPWYQRVNDDKKRKLEYSSGVVDAKGWSKDHVA